MDSEIGFPGYVGVLTGSGFWPEEGVDRIGVMTGGKGILSPVPEREPTGVSKSGLWLLIWFVFVCAIVDDSGLRPQLLFVKILVISLLGTVLGTELWQEERTATTCTFQKYYY